MAFGDSSRWWQSPGIGNNPLFWSLPVGSVAGISIRVSLIYIVWMLMRIVSAGEVGFTFQIWLIASLFLLVLLHEFGHCFACRAVGGQADNILMWMCGGLASCRPPHNWRASLITTAGGPGVNLALLPVFAGVMYLLGAPLSSLFFNPWGGGSLGTAWSQVYSSLQADLPLWCIYGLFTLHVSNAGLLLFNLLLVFFPFDGGRLVQEVLWWRLGYTRSMRIATVIGMAGGIGLAALGLYARDFGLILIGGFGWFASYQQRQQLRFMAASELDMPEERWSQWGAEGDSWKRGRSAGTFRPATAREKRAAEKARNAARKEREAEIAETNELDRILAKIKATGMASLTNKEQAFLRRSSQVRRD